MTGGTGTPSARRVADDVRFNVLGPLTVTEGTRTFNIGGPKQRTVLAMLIAHAGHQVSVGSIIDAVWGDEAAANAKRIVQTYVATLRGEVGDAIVKTGQGWRLDVPVEEIDAHAFEQIYSSSRNEIDSNPEGAAVTLRESLSLWRGHPYADVEAHGLLDAEIHRLAELRVSAQLARIDADLASGRHSDLVGEIEGLLAEHPYREQLRAQHMLALYRAGRQKEALRSFEDMRTLLVEELGVDPTPELRDLEQRILEQDDALHPTPSRSIQKRAVLVADPGNPLELARLPEDERVDRLVRSADVLRSAVGRSGGGELHPAGTATYVVFDSPDQAAEAARAVAQRFDGSRIRMAIDWGDIEVSDDGISGPPVSRAAMLVSVTHPGQVVLSPDAQAAILSGGGGAGLRFESLGTFELSGVEKSLAVYQLLMGDPLETFPPLETDRVPPPLPEGGHRSVTGYELREPLGTGSLGTLYRAYQPSIGREVMVEVISRAESSDAEFIRNFEFDTQRLALLDHPNINELLDYWRDPEGAYLVYRYHRGGFLKSGADATHETLAQVGSALGYAHSHGLVHGSFRPDRVMIDESGNAHVLGFPLAGVRPQSSPEYPAYIARETLAGEPATVATDVYALGVLAHEVESGSAVGVDMPTRLSEAVRRATSESPVERHESIGDLLAELSPSTEDSAQSRFTPTRNPYKGLSAFHESDAGDFFGRDEAVRELVSALTANRFLAVIGPSGIGKSSVVRAGLVPALRRGAVDGSESWVVTDMLPGSHPFLELHRALERIAVDLPNDIRERFADRDPNALAGLGRRVLPPGAELLVVVDQFEELFTMADEAATTAFLDLLKTATEMDQARFVVTMRADFVDRPLLYSDFGQLLRQSTIMLRAPDLDELTEAIQKPAIGVGVKVDPGLVERMATEVHDQPGALPLLQHTLAELFNSRASDLIGIDTYEDGGGIRGSLTARAEASYAVLDDRQRSVVKQVFLRLVTLVDGSAPTRRRVRVTDLGAPDAEESVMAFVRNRLLVLDSDEDTRTPTVEVAHEALLHNWPRLAGWIEDAREDLVQSRRLEESMSEWEASGRDDAYLLTGGRLTLHQDWVAGTSLSLTGAEQAFLEASLDHDQGLRVRRRRRRNLITAGFGSAAIVAGVLALSAFESAGTARAESLAASAVAALETDPELSVLLGVEAMERDPTSSSASTALNQALQAHRTALRIDGPSIGSISPNGRLLAASTATELKVWGVGPAEIEPLWSWPVFEGHFIGEAYFSSDNSTVIVVTVVDGGPCNWDRFTLFDAQTGDEIVDRDLVDLNTYWGGPSQNGPYIDLGKPIILGSGHGADAGACHRNPSIGELVAVNLLSGEQTPLAVGATAVGRGFNGMPTLSDDGTVFTHADTRRGVVVERETGVELLDLPGGLSTLSPDGTLVLTGNNPLELWTVETGEKLREFKANFHVAWFSSSGSMVYGSSVDGRVLVFDADTGDLLFELRGHSGAVVRIQMTEDESRIATFSDDSSVRMWDVTSPLISTSGSTVFPASFEGEHAFFQLTDSYITTDHLLAKRAVFENEEPLSQDIPSTSGLDETTVFSLDTGDAVNSYLGSLVAVSPDGTVAALQSSGSLVEWPEGVYVPYGPLVIADPLTGASITVLDGLCQWYDGAPSDRSDFIETNECEGYPGPWREYVNHAFFSGDGSLLAMAGETGRFAVWDVETGEMIWSRDTESGEDMGLDFTEANVAFSPDGRYLVVALRENIEVLETDSFKEVGGFKTDFGSASRMEFTPDGSLLVLNDQALNVIVVDTEDWERVHTLSGQQGFYFSDIAVDPTGRFVATAGLDGESRVWDLESGELVQHFVLPKATLGLRNVAWVDESTLMVGSRFWAVLLTVDTEALIETARERLTRSFTAEECSTYNIDPCPTLEEVKTG